MENQGNSKKTWELINRIRGKQHLQLKPMFIIDNEKITNRRNIANMSLTSILYPLHLISIMDIMR